MNKKKLFLAALVIAAGLGFFIFDLQAYFNLEYFQSQRQALLDFKDANFALSSLAYFVLYVLVAALSLPAAAVLTIVGGAIFGLWWGLLLVSFASSIGATLAFLLARSILRSWVQERFGDKLAAINRGMARDGKLYLFTLRLLPIFPFFLINVVMGLTAIRVRDFYWISQVGMLFGTAVYVNVGAQLGQATSLPDVLSGGMLLAMLLLAFFPWLARLIVNIGRQQKLYRDFPRPKHFDTNLLVIGAGAAGLVTSYIAALVQARVILVEKHKMGGDCLNTGCVPSKALIRSAGLSHLFRRAGEFGLKAAPAEVDFPAVMQRIREVIRKIEPHDSVERYTKLGVECLSGVANILSPFSVEVNGRTITTRNIVLATGGRPVVPDIPGLDQVKYVTSDTIWELDELPGRLLVLGAGPIGCELAQAFARLGSQVTQVDQGSRLLPKEDPEVSELIAERFSAEGIRFVSGHTIAAFDREGDSARALLQKTGQQNDEGAGQAEQKISFDVVLLAVGRTGNTEGFGLEKLGLARGEDGRLEVNEYLQTSLPNIYACGDLIGPYQFTHMAAHQAWFAAVNSLFTGLKKFKVDYRIVPWATFTDPEVARVGLSETEARAQGVEFEVSRYGIDDLDRAIVDGDAEGFVKVLTVPGKDRILGALIVSQHAAELLPEFVLAMKHGLGLNKLLSTIHVYPTWNESNKYLAGEWKRQHAPVWLYPWLQKFHSWRRR